MFASVVPDVAPPTSAGVELRCLVLNVVARLRGDSNPGSLRVSRMDEVLFSAKFGKKPRSRVGRAWRMQRPECVGAVHSTVRHAKDCPVYVMRFVYVSSGLRYLLLESKV